MSMLHLAIEFPGVYYTVFFILAFQIGLALLLYQGYKHKFPITPWLLIILTGFLFFVIGSKLFAIPAADWAYIFQSGILQPEMNRRTVLGGAVTGLLGIVLAIRWFNFPVTTLDSFAVLIPLTLIFQRVGCFIAGCCFGSPTTLPWSISYSHSHHAFQHHVSLNLVSPTELSSLPIHPVQLYEAFGCMLIVFFLIKIRQKKYILAPGSLLMVSALLYGLLRFMDEFFRAGQPVSGPLNKIQFITIALMLILLPALIWNERVCRHSTNQPILTPSTKSIVLYFLMVALLYTWFWPVIGTLEVLALNPLVILSILAILYTAITAFINQKMSWTSALLVTLMFVLTAQVAPQDTEDKSAPSHYYTLAVNVLTGNHTLVDRELVEEDCEGNKTYAYARFREKYKAGSASFSKTIVYNEYNKMTFGLNGQMGSLQETGQANLDTKRILNFYTINPFIAYDTRDVGIGGGLHIGDISVLQNSFDSDRPTLIKRYRIYPQLNLRAGQLQSFFGEFRFADAISGTFPSSVIQINLGYGFHSTNGNALRIGTSSHAALFIAPSFAPGKNIVITPFIAFGESPFSSFNESQKNFLGSIKVAYNFGK
jgi:prolipoprotein diacylglyceryltransferase